MTLQELIEVLDSGFRIQDKETKQGIPLNKDSQFDKYEIKSIYAQSDDLIIVEVEEV